MELFRGLEVEGLDAGRSPEVVTLAGLLQTMQWQGGSQERTLRAAHHPLCQFFRKGRFFVLFASWRVERVYLVKVCT